MKASEIKIGNRVREDVGDLNTLAQSIDAIGLLHPVVINSDGWLVAGMRRYLAMTDVLGWTDIPVRVVNGLEDGVQALRAERDENAQRRDLTPFEAVEMGRLLEPLEQEAAAQRMTAGVPLGNLPEGSGRALDNVASAVGMGRRTYERAKAVMQAADEEPEEFGHLAMKLKEDGVSVNSVFGQLRTQQNWNKLKSADNIERLDRLGKYSVIYADPPWKYEPGATTTDRDVQNFYPTMEIEDICALPVQDIADEDCILFLWATPPLMEQAFSVITAWGFTYRAQIIWVKDRMGMGHYVRNQHELLLIAKRGNMRTPLPEDRPSSILQARVGEHSQKPRRAYELIEQMYPVLPKIELFSRAQRPGWKAWGLEAARGAA